MLTHKNLRDLKKDDEYVNTLSVRYNLNYALSTIKAGHGNASVTINTDGSVSAGIDFARIVWVVFKAAYISKEIGQFRNLIIENTFNYEAHQCEFNDFINSSYHWVDKNADKIRDLKSYTARFLSDSSIAILFIEYSSSSNKELRYKDLTKRVLERYDEYIEKLKWKHLQALASDPLTIRRIVSLQAIEASKKGFLTDGKQQD